jgi:hypothetical protein
MSLERRSNDVKKKETGFLKGAALGASMLVGGVGGGYVGIEKGMQEVNAHLLSPAAIHELKQETGASDKDIARLEGMLRDFARKELKRSLDQN